MHGLGSPPPRAALRPLSPCLPRPADSAEPAGRRAGPGAREGARWRGRGGVSGPGRPGYLGAREGGRGAALAQPGLGGLGKFPHYRCQLTKALMSPSAPGPCRGGEGRWGRRTGLSSAVRAGGPPSLISSELRRPCLPANFH